MIASALLATTLASTSPPAAPATPVAVTAATAPSAPATAKPAMASGKMDCCKDGCACCGKDKAAKAASAPEHQH